jgi:hypothetical protein
MKLLRDGKIQWVRVDQMCVGDKILIDRSYRWHDGSFDCTINEAYILGLLIGDGCWTNKYKLGFATEDIELANALLQVNKSWVKTGDGVHWNLIGKQNRLDWLNFWQLDNSYTKDKKLPETILAAPRCCMTACLQGLFDTDGTLQIQTTKGGTAITISFCNTSEDLVKQIQYILLHYGIISCVTFRDRHKNWNRVYELLITGQNVPVFSKEIGFRLNRKQQILEYGLSQKKRNYTNGDDVPGVKDDLVNIATKYNCSNPSVCASKIKSRKKITRDLIVKFIDAYSGINYSFIEKLLDLANPHIYYDEIVSITDSECQTYDIHIPDEHEYCANGFFSHNTKIRGMRANIVLVDEFNSVNPEIYETVIAGFAAVSQNPIQNVKEAAKRKVLQGAGLWSKVNEEAYRSKKSNQAILSGTCGYTFEHFYSYWKRYHGIIESKGDPKKLAQVLGEDVDDFMSTLDWRDFSIIRIPFELVPEGFMDEKQVVRSKATMHAGIYDMEYGAVFTADSQGFFKRSLIESCVAHEANINKESWPSWCKYPFDPKVRGNSDYQYVMGVDPASEEDNFALVILELHPEHQRVVHVWTTNRKDFKERQKAGLTDMTDYYAYCVRRIRDLMRVFNIIRIGIDTQGGGHQITE